MMFIITNMPRTYTVSLRQLGRGRTRRILRLFLLWSRKECLHEGLQNRDSKRARGENSEKLKVRIFGNLGCHRTIESHLAEVLVRNDEGVSNENRGDRRIVFVDRHFFNRIENI